MDNIFYDSMIKKRITILFSLKRNLFDIFESRDIILVWNNFTAIIITDKRQKYYKSTINNSMASRFEIYFFL